MRPVRAASFLLVLAAAACGTPPLVGEYEGPSPAATATAKDAVPAELELRDDGSCLWHAAVEHIGFSYFIPLGSWSVDSTRRGRDVVVVHPDPSHPERSLRFDVTTARGDTVLVAEDGTRLVRKG